MPKPTQRPTLKVCYLDARNLMNFLGIGLGLRYASDLEWLNPRFG
jgi:hypothetical protein